MRHVFIVTYIYNNINDYDTAFEFMHNLCFLSNQEDFSLVSQTCDAEGMEFTLRIPEGFWGRIYTHNHYGRGVFDLKGIFSKIVKSYAFFNPCSLVY